MGKSKLVFEKYKKFLLPAGIGIVVVAAIVMSICAFLGAKAEKAEILEHATTILDYEDDVQKLISAEDMAEVDFAMVGKIVAEAESLLNVNGFCKGDEAQQRCNKIKQQTSMLSDFNRRAELLSKGLEGEFTDENLDAMASGDYGAVLEAMAEDVRELRAMVEDFSEKYGEDSKIDDAGKTQMIIDYSAIEQYGEDIEKRYNAKTFKEVYGCEKDELLDIFETIKTVKAEVEA